MASSRRRGEELEHALLTAAWTELIEVGYAKLTIENVAARAATSTPVIYRRWPTRAKLVLAALAHNVPLEESTIDTGSLRGDLLELIGRSAERARRLISETFREPDASQALRRRITQDEDLELIRPFLTRAVERRELLTDQCSDRVLRIPFDLLRTETLLYGTMPGDETVTEIVDDIALPLFRLHCGTPGTTR